MYRTALQIYRRIIESKHVLLIPHQNPDGDALGTTTACAEWLHTIGKPYSIFCATAVSPRFRYLPHIKEIKNDVNIWNTEIFDTIVVFDSGDLRYAGVADFIASRKNKSIVINMDHHATNEHYGDLNMVDPSASSTAEVLYRFFVQNHIAVSTRMSTSLLTGIMTDTEHFTNSATSKSALTVGSALLQKGGNFQTVQGFNFKDKTLNTLQLWGCVLSRLEKNEQLDLVYTYLTQEDLAKYHVTETEAEGIANFLNNLRDGKSSLILKELPDGNIKGSFRTTRNDTDVSAIAKTFGGGGHKKAAGFTVQGPMKNAIQHIFATLESTIVNKPSSSQDTASVIT